MSKAVKRAVLGSLLVMGVSVNVYAEEAVKLNTQQQTQLQTQQHTAPIPKGNGLENQQPKKKMIQHKNMNQHQKTFEGELQKAEKAKKGNGISNGNGNKLENRVGNRPDNRSVNGGNGSVNRMGNGKH